MPGDDHLKKGATQREGNDRPSNRMPEDSAFFERGVPILLSTLSVITLGLILFALGVLIGLIPF